MADEKKIVEISDTEMEKVDGGFSFTVKNVDPDYCPKSPDHKHCFRTVLGVKSCLFCSAHPTR